MIKTWKQSTDPDFEAKQNRVLHLYEIAAGKAKPGRNDPTVVICMDKLYGHIKTTKNRTTFLEFCRYPRTLYPPDVRIMSPSLLRPAVHSMLWDE